MVSLGATCASRGEGEGEGEVEDEFETEFEDEDERKGEDKDEGKGPRASTITPSHDQRRAAIAAALTCASASSIRLTCHCWAIVRMFCTNQ
jgi:hypothetical protein